ncbi:MAG: DUF4252 domain-containing protein [Muribaculaceae bacterium]|nr:DUF4252 domain-containing protein [Muribaculaceae bacterium]
MKKILVLAVVALSFATGLCRSIDDAFNAFPKADNVQLVEMPGILDMIQSKFDAKSKEKNGPKSIIESVKILIIEDATDQQKDIARQILDEGIDDMEEMVSVNDDEEDVTILSQQQGDHIAQMLIIVFDNEENGVGVVHLKGVLRSDDIENMGMFN